MALLTHGSSPATARTEPAGGTGQAVRNRRLRLTRHRSGADAGPPQAEMLHPVADADGVTRIDLTAFEQVVRGTPARGFPSLVTPARGIALPAVDGDAWAGTLLPHEAEPFPVADLREPRPGERWSLDDDAALPRAVAAQEPVARPAARPAARSAARPAAAPVAARVVAPVAPPVEDLPEIEPLALAQIRQELPLIPVEPPALPASFTRPDPVAATPVVADPVVAEPVTAEPEVAPSGAAKVEPAAPAPAALAPVRPAAPAGRHPAMARAAVGLGLAAGAAIAIGSAALLATVSSPAEGATPSVTPTITIPAAP